MYTFGCPNCGQGIVVQYLKSGETAQCKGCGADIVVPKEGEKPTLLRKPEAAEKPSLGDTEVAPAEDRSVPVPKKRFHGLRTIAAAYKTIAGIVGVVFGLAIVALIIMAADAPSPGGLIIVALAMAAVGAVMVVILLSFGDIIMVQIATEENTRAVREMVQKTIEKD